MLKRSLLLLPVMIALILVPFKHTSATERGNTSQMVAAANLPLPQSVIGIAGAVSGIGVAGQYLFNRRHK